MPELKYRISPLMFGFMLLVGGIIEGLQFLLNLTVVLSVLAMFVGAVGMGIITAWLGALGVLKFDKAHGLLRLLTLGAGWVITVIPLISGLPEITTAIIVSYTTSRIEDRINHQMALAAWKKKQADEKRKQQQLATQQAQYQEAANQNAEEEAFLEEEEGRRAA